jgi:hypothetical protein
MDGRSFAAVGKSSSNSRRPRRSCTGACIQLLERRFLLTAVVVNTTLDGMFPPGSGIISLRNAVATANKSATPSTITFDPGVFATAQTITLNGNALELANSSASIAISGPPKGVTISGNNKAGGFVIDPYTTATLSNLTVTKSASRGLQNDGTLKLIGVTVSGNTTTDYPGGGGIYNSGGAGFQGILDITNSVISSNGCPVGSGGGIFNYYGTVTLTNTTVAGNTASDSAGIASNGVLSLTDVTVSGNTASTGDGGGIANGSIGTATLTNVTLSSNKAPNSGGAGMYNDGTATLTNVSIDNNIASDKGGGIESDLASHITIVNTILAGNSVTGSGATGPDAYGTFNSLGHNLIGKTDASTGWNGGDFAGTIAHPLAAKLGVLANNGGPTQTLLPFAGSAAIDHGFNALIPKNITTDQRGLPRIANGTVDIGAVEVQPVAVKGSIAGNVFADTNANGNRESDEKGLTGVKVYIDANKSGAVDAGEASVVTDAAGNFKFANLAAGTYRIREVLPSGYAITAPLAGYFDVAVKAGQAASGFIFADAPATASISGRVFNDANGNGLRDGGEMGLGLWQVFIDYNNDGKIDGKDVAVATDINGNWSFKGLIAGTYAVRVVAVAGNAATKPTGGVMGIKLAAGQASGGNVFGERAIG